MVSDDNALIRLQRKLQLLKIAIKSWTKEFRLKSNAKKCQIQQDILCLDKLFDLGLINDDSLNKRALLLNELHEINSVNASDLSQKAKIRWSIEGDENSKFFHGIINKKRAQLAIRGILADGNWISEPSLVKNKFFHHLVSSFLSPHSSYILFRLMNSMSVLHLIKWEDLESEISYEEVMRFVWDCGIGVNKSPVVTRMWAVKAFFSMVASLEDAIPLLLLSFRDSRCHICESFLYHQPNGSTSKLSLISWHNRLLSLLPDLFSDVDFEKAFDSVKWDYLDETLKSFGFGLKWRNWISGCLNNAKGSVLVNGNPTKEFQFFKVVGGLHFIKAWCGFMELIGSQLCRLAILMVDCLLAVLSYKDNEKFPRLYALEESKSISVADKLGLLIFHPIFRRPPRGGIEQESFNLLCQSVRGLVLSNIEDRWSWSLEGSGLFSVKSSRAYIDDLLLHLKRCCDR
ncbi:RNA-directed DNA polymerase, eukaryota [Tanacetum coccineum]